MARTEATGVGFIFSLIDIIGFFDNEQILDVMDCLDKVGVSRKAAKCWFKLNEKTEIRVNTAAGMTAAAEAGDLVGQGTAGAGLMSQLNLDTGLQQYYAGSGDEMYYGGVRIEYTAYQDDIGKPSKGVKEAQAHMVKLAYMFQDKGLEAHPDKSGYIVFKGSKENMLKMQKELKINPIMFEKFSMNRKTKDKYLGQILREDGLAASAAATVEDRAGRFKGAVFEIRSVIEEFSMQCIGGMMAAKILLERALLPSLLSGCCNWTGVKKKTEEECDELIYLYWRVIFKVPDSTIKIGLIAETSTLRTKWRIWQSKLMFVRRLQQLESSALARQVYERQLQLGLPGLAREVTAICDSIKIPDVNYHMVEKDEIEEHIFYNHYKDMKDSIMMSKKMDKIKNEDFTKEQDYMNYKSVDRSRTQLKIRLEMVETFKDNFRTKYQTLARGEEDRDPGLVCGDCGQSRDSQSH